MKRKFIVLLLFIFFINDGLFNLKTLVGGSKRSSNNKKSQVSKRPTKKQAQQKKRVSVAKSNVPKNKSVVIENDSTYVSLDEIDILFIKSLDKETKSLIENYYTKDISDIIFELENLRKMLMTEKPYEGPLNKDEDEKDFNVIYKKNIKMYEDKIKLLEKAFVVRTAFDILLKLKFEKLKAETAKTETSEIEKPNVEVKNNDDTKSTVNSKSTPNKKNTPKSKGGKKAKTVIKKKGKATAKSSVKKSTSKVGTLNKAETSNDSSIFKQLGVIIEEFKKNDMYKPYPDLLKNASFVANSLLIKIDKKELSIENIFKPKMSAKERRSPEHVAKLKAKNEEFRKDRNYIIREYDLFDTNVENLGLNPRLKEMLNDEKWKTTKVTNKDFKDKDGKIIKLFGDKETKVKELLEKVYELYNLKNSDSSTIKDFDKAKEKIDIIKEEIKDKAKDIDKNLLIEKNLNKVVNQELKLFRDYKTGELKNIEKKRLLDIDDKEKDRTSQEQIDKMIKKRDTEDEEQEEEKKRIKIIKLKDKKDIKNDFENLVKKDTSSFKKEASMTNINKFIKTGGVKEKNSRGEIVLVDKSLYTVTDCEKLLKNLFEEDQKFMSNLDKKEVKLNAENKKLEEWIKNKKDETGKEISENQLKALKNSVEANKKSIENVKNLIQSVNSEKKQKSLLNFEYKNKKIINVNKDKDLYNEILLDIYKIILFFEDFSKLTKINEKPEETIKEFVAIINNKTTELKKENIDLEKTIKENSDKESSEGDLGKKAELEKGFYDYNYKLWLNETKLEVYQKITENELKTLFEKIKLELPQKVFDSKEDSYLKEFNNKLRLLKKNDNDQFDKLVIYYSYYNYLIENIEMFKTLLPNYIIEKLKKDLLSDQNKVKLTDYERKILNKRIDSMPLKYFLFGLESDKEHGAKITSGDSKKYYE